MAKPIDIVKYTGELSEEALDKALIQLSKANPKCAVMAGGQFGNIKLFVYSSLSAVPVDSPESRYMSSVYGGLAFVNGRLQQPTQGWLRRQIAVDNATGND